MNDSREYYRSNRTGDLGYLVRSGDKSQIRLDRPNQEILAAFTDEWIPEQKYKPFSKYQLTQVAFEADRQMCRMLGMHTLANRQWLSLSEDARIEFIKSGPQGPDVRGRLFGVIMKTLSEELMG